MCRPGEPCPGADFSGDDAEYEEHPGNPDTPPLMSSACTTPNESRFPSRRPSNATMIRVDRSAPPPALLTQLLPAEMRTPPNSPATPGGAAAGEGKEVKEGPGKSLLRRRVELGGQEGVELEKEVAGESGPGKWLAPSNQGTQATGENEPGKWLASKDGRGRSPSPRRSPSPGTPISEKEYEPGRWVDKEGRLSPLPSGPNSPTSEKTPSFPESASVAREDSSSGGLKPSSERAVTRESSMSLKLEKLPSYSETDPNARKHFDETTESSAPKTPKTPKATKPAKKDGEGSKSSPITPISEHGPSNIAKDTAELLSSSTVPPTPKTEQSVRSSLTAEEIAVAIGLGADLESLGSPPAELTSPTSPTSPTLPLSPSSEQSRAETQQPPPRSPPAGNSRRRHSSKVSSPLAKCGKSPDDMSISTAMSADVVSTFDRHDDTPRPSPPVKVETGSTLERYRGASAPATPTAQKGEGSFGVQESRAAPSPLSPPAQQVESYLSVQSLKPTPAAGGAPPPTPRSDFTTPNTESPPPVSSDAPPATTNFISILRYLSALNPPHLPTTTALSMRDPSDPTTFLIAPAHLPAYSILPPSLLRFAIPSGKLISTTETIESLARDRKVNIAAAFVHARIFGMRPDVNAVCGSQSRIIGAFSAVEWNWNEESGGLAMVNAEACAFYKSITFLPTFSALLSRPKEAKSIAASLGPHKAMIMKNHGVMTVGASLESCIYWLTSLERCAAMQMRVWSLGRKVSVIENEKAEGLGAFVGSEEAGRRAGRAEMEGAEVRFV